MKRFQWLDWDLHAFRKILFLLSFSKIKNLQKSHLDLSLCLFFLPKKNAFLTGVDKILPQSTNDERQQTRLQINIIQDTKPEGLLLTMMMADLVFLLKQRIAHASVCQQTSHDTSTSTIMAWNVSSIHTLIRLIFKSRSFSLSSDY